jgi:hypothetical protein
MRLFYTTFQGFFQSSEANKTFFSKETTFFLVRGLTEGSLFAKKVFLDCFVKKYFLEPEG